MKTVEDVLGDGALVFAESPLGRMVGGPGRV